MVQRRWVAIVFAVLAVTAPPARAGDELASKIEAFINGPTYKQAH